MTSGVRSFNHEERQPEFDNVNAKLFFSGLRSFMRTRPIASGAFCGVIAIALLWAVFRIGDSDSIPADLGEVPYSIVDEKVTPGIKRVLTVRLEREITEARLTQLAWHLKSLDARQYERTFILYLLPEMLEGKGAWASTHFIPNLEVESYGLSAEQKAALSKLDSREPIDNAVGTWIDDRPHMGARITIYRIGGKASLTYRYKDQSFGEFAIKESNHNGAPRFDYDPDRGNGEYFIINSDGDLQEFDAEGLIFTAKKLD